MRRQLLRGCASLARPAPPPAFVPPAEARLPSCNVPPGLWPRVSRGLHRDAGHPLGAVARAVVAHFPGFTLYDALPPIVTVAQNFDDLLVPASHPSRP